MLMVSALERVRVVFQIQWQGSGSPWSDAKGPKTGSLEWQYNKLMLPRLRLISLPVLKINYARSKRTISDQI